MVQRTTGQTLRVWRRGCDRHSFWCEWCGLAAITTRSAIVSLLRGREDAGEATYLERVSPSGRKLGTRYFSGTAVWSQPFEEIHLP